MQTPTQILQKRTSTWKPQGINFVSFETDFEALKISFYDLRSIHSDWEILRMQPTGSYWWTEYRSRNRSRLVYPWLIQGSTMMTMNRMQLQYSKATIFHLISSGVLSFRWICFNSVLPAEISPFLLDSRRLFILLPDYSFSPTHLNSFEVAFLVGFWSKRP